MCRSGSRAIHAQSKTGWMGIEALAHLMWLDIMLLSSELQRFGGGVAGFLGDQYNPFILPGDASNPGFTVRDVTLPSGVDPNRFKRRMKVLETVDTWQAQVES